MKLKELRDLLDEMMTEMPGDTIVVMACDGEGNSHTPLAAVNDECVYRAEQPWCGEVGFATLTPSLEKIGYTEDDVIEDGQPCIILEPTK